jgi:hypothetical protein
MIKKETEIKTKRIEKRCSTSASTFGEGANEGGRYVVVEVKNQTE